MSPGGWHATSLDEQLVPSTALMHPPSVDASMGVVVVPLQAHVNVNTTSERKARMREPFAKRVPRGSARIRPIALRRSVPGKGM